MARSRRSVCYSGPAQLDVASRHLALARGFGGAAARRRRRGGFGRGAPDADQMRRRSAAASGDRARPADHRRLPPRHRLHRRRHGACATRAATDGSRAERGTLRADRAVPGPGALSSGCPAAVLRSPRQSRDGGRLLLRLRRGGGRHRRRRRPPRCPPHLRSVPRPGPDAAGGVGHTRHLGGVVLRGRHRTARLPPAAPRGKVLGLAAWGDPKPLQEAFRRALRCASSGRALTSDFAGRPDADAERIAYLEEVIRGHTRENVAAAAQRTLEEAVIPLVQTALNETGARHVALNGGVFANVRLNQHIAALPGVERVFVFPGMSDTGNSVGAALLALADLDPGAFARGRRPLDTVYWGPGYEDDEIRQALDAVGARHERVSPPEIVERTARAIHEGLVVGWFQGRMEFGPRALGNRSIVASPVDGTINKRLNDRLSRTEFMPFAPSVLAEHAHTIFADVRPAAHTAEFMTMTLEVTPPWRPRIAAVVHVDGTARPHLVVREKNPLYHRLVERYHELSGIPLVLNTSFNVHEEPIVCQPSEAARALVEGRVDRLAIGPFWAGQPGRTPVSGSKSR